MAGISWEIWCSNWETGRFDEKLGDSRENRGSWQVCHILINSMVHNPVPRLPRSFVAILKMKETVLTVSKISEMDLWSHKQATSFPCEKSDQNLNWVANWSLLCLQGISVATANLIGFTEKLHHRMKNGQPFCVEKFDPVQ